MKRILVIAAAFAALAACTSKGGVFELKTGGDPTHLGDYACNPRKGS
jgi:hypothetical protein